MVPLILAVDGLALFEVIDEYNNASHNTDASWPLRLSTLRIRFIALSSLGWLSIGLWSVGKIRLYYGWISLNIAPNHQRCWFWSIVSKCGSHFATSFSRCKYSYTICSIHFFDILRVSAISIKFTLRSFKIILWTFLCFRRKQPLLGVKVLLNGWFRWCRVQIMFFKTNLGFNSTFFDKKQCFSNTRNYFLSIFSQYTKVSSLEMQYLTNQLSDSCQIYTHIFWMLVLTKNHMDFLLVTLFMCQTVKFPAGLLSLKLFFTDF
jgi:hypothetical protein